jgi:hypothetical protein
MNHLTRKSLLGGICGVENQAIASFIGTQVFTEIFLTSVSSCLATKNSGHKGANHV